MKVEYIYNLYYLFYECRCTVYDLGNIIEICVSKSGYMYLGGNGKGNSRKRIMGGSGGGEKRMLILKISLSRISY